jgi:hypothetical protein
MYDFPRSAGRRIRPAEITFLQSIHDEACALRSVHPHSDEALDIASIIMAAFRGGTESRDSLLALAKGARVLPRGALF